MKNNKCNEEEARKQVPETYKSMPPSIKDEILDNFNSLMALKKQGVNLFFADIDGIKEKMLEEIK